MALVEFCIRIQTKDVDDKISPDEEAEIERMLSDMEEVVYKSTFTLDECMWEEV